MIQTEKELIDDIGKEYLEILRDPKLWERISAELSKTIVGEERAKKTIFLNANGRNVINCDKTSFNLLLDSESGAGKDYITRNVLKILPAKECIIRRAITPKTLRWMNKDDESWTWDKKVLYIEDIPDSVLNDETFKTMCSSEEGTSSAVESTDKGIKITTIEVRGKPVIIITSASPNLIKEMIRRFGSLNLDESIDQTKAIIKRKLKNARTGKTERYNDMLRCAIGCLKRESVVIPWAGRLESFIPDNLILRTSINRFLDFIKSACVLHQYQRERNDDGFLIAQKEDYEFAKPCFESIISTKWLTLSQNEQRVLKVIGKLNDDITGLSVPDLEPHITFITTKSLYKCVKKLANSGLLKCESQERESSKKPVLVYKSMQIFNVNLPSWEDLEKTTIDSNDIIDSINTIDTNDSGRL